MSYNLPGVKITQIDNSVTASVSSTQRVPAFIGTASAYVKVQYEAVVRGSGLSDTFAFSNEKIHAVTFVGSQKRLKDFTEGVHYTATSTGITFTSTGVIAAGTTYYVSYQYVRPDEDYAYKEFSAYEDVLADLGDDIPANSLVNIAKLALSYYGVPKIGVVQVRTNTDDAYVAALSEIKYQDVQSVGILNSSSKVRAAGVSHVTERSIPDNKFFRIFYTGAPATTEHGTTDNGATICGMSYAVQNERVVFVNAPRALYYYNDPDTGVEKSAVVDGAFIGAAIAAYRDSFLDPTTTLINRTLPGLYLFQSDYNKHYNVDRLKEAGAASCFLLKNSGTDAVVVDDLTTDNSSVERNNINIITAKDFIAKDIINQMDRKFKGRLIKNRALYKNTVYGFLATLMASYLANGYITQIDKLAVTFDASRKDTVNFYYSYFAVYTNKYLEGQYSISQ